MKVVVNLVRRLCRCRPRVVFAIGPVAEQVGPVRPSKRCYYRRTNGESDVDLTLTDNQFTTFKVTGAKDKKGNAVEIPDGSLTWGTDNTDLLLLEPSSDTKACKVSAVGPIGSGILSVKTADNQISGQSHVTVVSGAPVTIDLTADTPAEESDVPVSPPPSPPSP